MEHVETALHIAWQRVRPSLDDPHVLAPRLARRRAAILTCPPRAWCLAIRASDRRIRCYDDDHAAGDRPHAIALTADLCRHLCAPVILPAPGIMLDEAADLLGTTPM